MAVCVEKSSNTQTPPSILLLLSNCSTPHPISRNFVFFYVVVLHLVVFFTLNYWSHSHSQNCNGGGGPVPEGRNGFFPDTVVPDPF